MKSYPLLKKAPKDHNSLEFLDFLRKNNKVVYDGDGWLVIENCKYHTPERQWLTAFWKGTRDGEITMLMTGWWCDMDILWYQFGDYEWLKKASSVQSVKRFHVHLIKK